MNLVDAMLDLAAVNHMDKSGFVRTLGGVFEHSPWIAERAFEAHPFASVEALHGAMVEVVEESTGDEQLMLLRAHPELAGKEARARTLSSSSTAEQVDAGLTALSRGEVERIAQLNRNYRGKFGFPFIIAARRHSKASIFTEFERRLRNDAATELATALAQVYVITRLRLDAMLLGR